MLIEIVIFFLVMFVVIAESFTMFRASLMTQSNIVSDCMVSANLAALDYRNLDLDIIAKDPNTDTVVIKDYNKALDTYLTKIKYNLNLDSNFQPVGESFLKSKVNLKEFIIYNVRGNNIDVVTYSPVTRTFTTTTVLDGKNVFINKKGSVVQFTSVYSSLEFDVEYIMGRTGTVNPSEVNDIAF